MIVSVEERTAVPVVGASAGAHGLDGELPTYMKPKRPVVNIYDLKNKIICGTSKKYHLALNDRVLFCLNDGGVVYLITTGGSMLRFREKVRNSQFFVRGNLFSFHSLVIMSRRIRCSMLQQCASLYIVNLTFCLCLVLSFLFCQQDTHRKLDVLLNQTSPPLYSLAIMLAAEEQLEPAEIMKLYKVGCIGLCIVVYAKDGHVQ